MLYWLKVYALVAALVFAPAGLIILSLLIWREAQAARPHTINLQTRLKSRDTTSFVANSFAISRTISRIDDRARLTARH